MSQGKDPTAPSTLVRGGVTKLNTQVQQHTVPKTALPKSRCPSSVIQFISKICTYAKSVAGNAGQSCACRVMAIQSGFETGWGTSSFSKDANNYFGLHGEGDAGSVPAAKDPKVKVAKFSSPAASFGNYWARAEKHGVSYQNDAQFIHDVTYKCVFSKGTEEKYIREILAMIAKCDQELNNCCACKKKK